MKNNLIKIIEGREEDEKGSGGLWDLAGEVAEKIFFIRLKKLKE